MREILEKTVSRVMMEDRVEGKFLDGKGGKKECPSEPLPIYATVGGFG